MGNLRFRIAVAGEHLDHGAGPFGSEQHAFRPAHDFHAVEPGGGQVREIERPARFGDGHAIEQNQRSVGVASARKQRSQSAVLSGLHHVDARHVAQQVLDECSARGLEILRGENIRRNTRLIDRQSGARVAVTTTRSLAAASSSFTALSPDSASVTCLSANPDLVMVASQARGKSKAPRAFQSTLVSGPQATCAPSTGRPLGSETTPRTLKNKNRNRVVVMRRSPSKRSQSI